MTAWRSLATAVVFACAATLGLGSSLTFAQGESNPLVIGAIELKGLGSVSVKEAEPLLEVTPGDAVDRVRVARSAQNLQQLYHSRGFEQVTIESRVTPKGKARTALLEFIVTEGKPTRVAEVLFTLKGDVRPETQKAWPVLQAKLANRYNNAVGGVFDQIKLGELQRGLQEELAAQEYVGSRVADPVVTSASQPLVLPRGGGAGATEAARWVKLEYPVELGDRVSFGFRGNSFLSKSVLSDLVEEQRLLGLGRDYITVLARKIEERYRFEGFAHVRVEPFSYDQKFPAERHVTYQVTEGPKVQIESVDFDGNRQFRAEELRAQFYATGGALIKSGVYVERDVQKAAESVLEWIKSKGYLSAKLFTINTRFPPQPRSKVQGSKVQLTVYLHEGDQTIVQSFAAQGNTVLSPSQIADHLHVKEGEPLNLFALTEGVEGLKAHYRDRGYLEMRVVNEGGNDLVTYSNDDRLADIRVVIEEGPRFKVSSISIEGLVHTEDAIVRRELEFKEGEVLEEHQIRESRTKLNRLGIFSSVDIRVVNDPEEPAHKRMRVLIEEAGRIVLEAGPGFRSDIGIRAFAQGTYSNAWGRNHTASLKFSTNARVQNRRFIEYQVRGNYLWPWIFLGDTSLRVSASLERWQYISFNADSLNAVIALERRLWKNSPLSASVAVSLEGVNQYGSPFSLDNQALRIGTLTPMIKLDLLDNLLAPTQGFYASGLFEWATPALLSQSDIHYTRFSFKSEGYIPLINNRLVIAGSFRTGIERNLNPAGNIPLLKQYTLGGVQTIRGFQEQEINIQNIVLGGVATYVNYRLQVDLPLPGALRIGPFIDAGNLLATATTSNGTDLTGSAGILGRAVDLTNPITVDRFFFGDMVYSAGVGLRYITPIGPFSLDWGFKLNAANLSQRIDISVGKIF